VSPWLFVLCVLLITLCRYPVTPCAAAELRRRTATSRTATATSGRISPAGRHIDQRAEAALIGSVIGHGAVANAIAASRSNRRSAQTNCGRSRRRREITTDLPSSQIAAPARTVTTRASLTPKRMYQKRSVNNAPSATTVKSKWFLATHLAVVRAAEPAA